MGVYNVKQQVEELIVQLRNRVSRARHSKVTDDEVKLLEKIEKLGKLYWKLESVSRARHDGPRSDEEEEELGSLDVAAISGQADNDYSYLFGDLDNNHYTSPVVTEQQQEEEDSDHPLLQSSQKPRLRIVD